MSPEASELSLYLDNEQLFYRQKMAIFRALAKKKDRGKYEHSRAPKAFAGLMTAAAKQYVREFGGPGDRWSLIFSPIDRRQAASHYADEFLDWYAIDYSGSVEKPRSRARARKA